MANGMLDARQEDGVCRRVELITGISWLLWKYIRRGKNLVFWALMPRSRRRRVHDLGINPEA
jgi:hypothetical protein